MKVLEHIDAIARPNDNREDTLLNSILSSLDNSQVLYLAGLFHDMGKGQGPGHEIKGEFIARNVLKFRTTC